MFSLLLVSPFFACKGCQENQILDQGKLQDTADVFSNDWGRWLDMTTLNDAPAVVYYDTTRGALGLATGTISGSDVFWSHQEIDGYPNEQGLDEGDRGLYASIEIDSTDTIWVAYYDVGLKNLRYATKSSDSTEWTRAVADSGTGNSPNVGLFADLTLDDNEYPVIAHYDEARNTLRVSHWDGSAFSSEIVDEGESVSVDESTTIDADVGKFPSIAIFNGTEYISYYDVASGSLKLATGTTGNYSIEVIDDTVNAGQWPSIQLYNETIYVTYHDVENNQLKIAYGLPGSFTIETIDQGEALGADTELLITSAAMYVAYHDGYNNDIKLATKTGEDDWTVATLDGAEDALGFHNELIELNGVVYAACYNYTEQTVWFQQIQ